MLMRCILRVWSTGVRLKPSGSIPIDLTILDENLYVGTSAAEILHFVALPPDLAEQSTEPTFILASRLPLTTASTAHAQAQTSGVSQILLLADVNKACILCNGVLTFYSLPELSPAFGSKQVANCKWIGGVDLDGNDETSRHGGRMIMVAVPSRLMLLRVGDELARVKNIGFPGCLDSARRETIACVADQHSYSLLEVEHQQKIPLFPISSLEEAPPQEVEQMSSRPSSMMLQPSATISDNRGHSRSTSLGAFVEGLAKRQSSPASSARDRRAGTESPDVISRSGTPAQDSLRVPANKPLPAPPEIPRVILDPHVVSPTPTEFLLTTGTGMSDPGVGIFVNTDGDVVRGTIEFERYPEALLLDGSGVEGDGGAEDAQQEGYVLAIMSREDDNDQKYVEIQRWDAEPGERVRKAWLAIPTIENEPRLHVNFVSTKSHSDQRFTEVGDRLRAVRLNYPGDSASDTEDDAKRNKSEDEFRQKLGEAHSNVALWSGNQIWRVVRNPQMLQLDNALDAALEGDGQIDQPAVLQIVRQLANADPRTETDFLGTIYIRQKASLALFQHLLSLDHNTTSYDADESVYRETQELLVDSGLDPRVILLMLPFLKDEVLSGPQGIWISSGIATLAQSYFSNPQLTSQALSSPLLYTLKTYLTAWQKRKGYASIGDEEHIFESIDAALLLLLLHLDAEHPTSVRNELNSLVDSWKGNFDRAVTLLERYNRIFVLSRLYQSRKMSREVLKCWRRIVDGEEDAGHEMSIAGVEARVRNYLVKIRDRALIVEYATWLATRNPKLGIQVFADDTSRVRFEPEEVVNILKGAAENSVQEYLEYLVFGKNVRLNTAPYNLNNLLTQSQLTQYTDDLISYYLSTVLSVLETSESARTQLQESYSTYRALEPPKPSYLNFITDNAPASEKWWQSRLRLLQLLSGSGNNFASTNTTTSKEEGEKISFSIEKVLTRLAPFSTLLVSETIILNGRQGHHIEALQLLVHGLGDYDTAIRYCLFGGIGPVSHSSSNNNGPITMTLPPFSFQQSLFTALLSSFLEIANPSTRIERTSSLLESYHSYFPVQDTLDKIPDEWTVEVVGGYLVRVMRDLVAERRERRIVRALAAGENLGVEAEWAEKGGRAFVVSGEEGDGRDVGVVEEVDGEEGDNNDFA